MGLPAFINQSEKDWIFKVTKETSVQPERDLCLLALFFGTPMTTLEINRIQIQDVLHRSGKLCREFVIRGNVSFNGDERHVFLKNAKVRKYLSAYLDHRIKEKILLGNHPDYFLSLDPDSPLFCTNKGRGEPGWRGFSIAKRDTNKGSVSYTCDALNRHLKQLLSKAGVQEPSILSGRRTFAVVLKRKGFDTAHIHHLLGNKSLETTEKLLDTDPVDMEYIASEGF